MDEMQAPQANAPVKVGDIVFTHDDLFRVVNKFYFRVQNDPVLSVPFQSVHDWPDHIKRLTHFWWVRFGGEQYLDVQYNPPMKHFAAGFNSELLARWLTMFHLVLHEELTNDQATLWKNISERMGVALSAKNEMLKKHFGGDQDRGSD